MAFRASVWPLATLPARMSMCLELSVVAASAGQVLHVAFGQEQRRVEAVAGEIARVQDAADVQVDLTSEAAKVLLLAGELAAGVDDDLGGVAGRSR